MKTEFEKEWFPIPGFESLYYVSKDGSVMSTSPTTRHVSKKPPKKRILKEYLTHKDKGYPCVKFWVKGKQYTFMIHRLLAILFVPNPHNKKSVNHINGIKTDYSIDNLEWCTQKENIHHAIKTGLIDVDKNKITSVAGYRKWKNKREAKLLLYDDLLLSLKDLSEKYEDLYREVNPHAGTEISGLLKPLLIIEKATQLNNKP